MDYINIMKSNGQNEVMEVVTIYNMSNSEYNYIIYKSLDNKEYYTGKYIGNDIVDLNTDLSEEEKVYAEGILNGLVGD